MADRKNKLKNTKALALRRGGCVTWNKKARRIVLMRIADPEAENPERHYMSQFILDGEDIQLVYQMLHEHFQRPMVASKVENWDPDMKKPKRLHTKAHAGRYRRYVALDQ